MKIDRRFLFVFPLLCISLNILSQEDLKGDEISQLYKIKLLNIEEYLETISSSSMSETLKRKAMSSILELCYNQGNSYIEDGITKEGVMISYESRNGRKYRPKPIIVFLSNMISLHDKSRYSVSAPIPKFDSNMKVSELHQLNDSIYTCVAYLNNAFTGMDSSGKIVYEDVTAPKGYVYLRKALIPTPDGITTKYIPLITGALTLKQK